MKLNSIVMVVLGSNPVKIPKLLKQVFVNRDLKKIHVYLNPVILTKLCDIKRRYLLLNLAQFKSVLLELLIFNVQDVEQWPDEYISNHKRASNVFLESCPRLHHVSNFLTHLPHRIPQIAPRL